MTITIAWNGGQNAVMFQPGAKMLASFMTIFTLGLLVVGGAAVALLAGAGYVVVTLAMLVLHVLTAIAFNTVFVQLMGLLLVASLLVFLIGVFLRYLATLWRQAHPQSTTRTGHVL